MASISRPISKIRDRDSDDTWVKDSESILHQHGIFLHVGEIHEDSARSIVSWILASNLDKSHETLKLIIQSEGGDLASAFSIVDTMRGSAIPIHTVGLGIVASCGLIIFMSGTKGHRTLTPNTQILSHQYSWGNFGKDHELVSATKEYKRITERMLCHYKKCTGLKEDKIKKYLLPPSDVWLSAEEALNLGLCDEIKLK
jgi:ATP-dependent Clp protease protease subunit